MKFNYSTLDKVPSPQANLENVILAWQIFRMEIDICSDNIAKALGFDLRQGSYYANAFKSLGIISADSNLKSFSIKKDFWFFSKQEMLSYIKSVVTDKEWLSVVYDQIIDNYSGETQTRRIADLANWTKYFDDKIFNSFLASKLKIKNEENKFKDDFFVTEKNTDKWPLVVVDDVQLSSNMFNFVLRCSDGKERYVYIEPMFNFVVNKEFLVGAEMRVPQEELVSIRPKIFKINNIFFNLASETFETSKHCFERNKTYLLSAFTVKRKKEVIKKSIESSSVTKKVKVNKNAKDIARIAKEVINNSNDSEGDEIWLGEFDE